MNINNYLFFERYFIAVNLDRKEMKIMAKLNAIQSLFSEPLYYTNINTITDSLEKMYSPTCRSIKIIDPLRELLKNDPKSIYYYIDR